jgi:hypothetical protein
MVSLSGDISDCRCSATFSFVAARRLCGHVVEWRHNAHPIPADLGLTIRDRRKQLRLDQDATNGGTLRPGKRGSASAPNLDSIVERFRSKRG